jgi:sugar/nucleoside kinase (ribokinase family)
MGTISVFGIGNPLMDYVAHGEFQLLKSLGATAGTMNLITLEQKHRILQNVTRYSNIPGGSCANTVRGLAWLGSVDPIAPPLYTGAVGRDSVGREYTEVLEKLGIHTKMGQKSSETGVSVIIVTPDYERTMFTYLGACRQYSIQDLDLDLLGRSSYLHITGYMWDTESQKKATLAALNTARKKGIRVSFDLADPMAVKRYKKDFERLIPDCVDVLFGNREEISLMLDRQGSYRELAEAAGALTPLVIMKVGADGCLVNDGGHISHIAGEKVEPVDTIGAGDFFASGFLFGLIKGKSSVECAVLANRLAAGIVTVEGCSLHKLDPTTILGED